MHREFCEAKAWSWIYAIQIDKPNLLLWPKRVNLPMIPIRVRRASTDTMVGINISSRWWRQTTKLESFEILCKGINSKCIYRVDAQEFYFYFSNKKI